MGLAYKTVKSKFLQVGACVQSILEAETTEWYFHSLRLFNLALLDTICLNVQRKRNSSLKWILRCL